MGVIFIIFWKLNFFENTVKNKSMASCVTKFTNTNVPSKVYEMLYVSCKVTNSNGGKQNMDDIVKYAE